jgi:hypothetical protein
VGDFISLYVNKSKGISLYSFIYFYYPDIILKQAYSEKYIKKIKKKCEWLSEDKIIDEDTYFSNVTYNEIMDNSIIVFNTCH